MKKNNEPTPEELQKVRDVLQEFEDKGYTDQEITESLELSIMVLEDESTFKRRKTSLLLQTLTVFGILIGVTIYAITIVIQGFISSSYTTSFEVISQSLPFLLIALVCSLFFHFFIRTQIQQLKDALQVRVLAEKMKKDEQST